MGDDRVERRALLGAGVGLLASLSGCGRLFVEPATTPTPDPDGSAGPTATPTATATPTPEPTPTATATPTPEPTPTAVSLPSDGIEVRNRRLSIRLTPTETFAFVGYGFEVENTGRRPISDVEFRVDVRYAHEDVSRVVATGYPRFWFVPLEDRDEDDDGLETDDAARVGDELRFERDGRAQGSTAVERFDIELSIRRVRRL